MKLTPLEDRVIILQDPSQEKVGEIYIPENARQKPASGKIIKVGPGKPEKDVAPIGYMVNDVFKQTLDDVKVVLGDRIYPVYPTPFVEGDHVFFSRFTGVPIDVDGTEYLCIRFSDLISRD